ncbi:hypothetical protein FQN57_002194 [Myotisia sp. PD_48]|nr:hypothetical protein FQN57_002194 [Myotisia sp. PD_48]
MAAPQDPMIKTYEMAQHKISKKEFVISGIICSVYGLEELPVDAKEVSCMYVLHPRSNDRASMEVTACTVIADWNDRLRANLSSAQPQNLNGLIAVCFDQRNHGTREVDKVSNITWREGNANHAQDMFAIFNGTTRDVSLLIDLMGCYTFPKSERKITKNLVLGVSLGAHAAWGAVIHDPRVTIGVVIVGTSDFINLMSDRARLSKIPAWKNSDPPGSRFLGSESFPEPLVNILKSWDPATYFLHRLKSSSPIGPSRGSPIREPTDEEKAILRPLLSRSLGGKKILNLSGALDKMVPYKHGEPFLTWLKKAIAPGGWCSDQQTSIEDQIFEGVGHEVTPPMVQEAVRFIGEALAADEGDLALRTSKM